MFRDKAKKKKKKWRGRFLILKPLRRTERIPKQGFPGGGPGEAGAIAVNGCYFSIFTPYNFVLKESAPFLNGSIVLSLLKDKRVALPPGLRGAAGNIQNLTNPFSVLFPYF